MYNLSFFNANGYALSLSNLQNGCNSIDIMDAVEDANTAEEFVANINKLDIIETFHIDRETSDYVRLVSVDSLGNKHYLKALKM